MTWDPYLDLSSGVLRNLLGITDADELATAEADFTSVRIAQLKPQFPARFLRPAPSAGLPPPHLR